VPRASAQNRRDLEMDVGRAAFAVRNSECIAL